MRRHLKHTGGSKIRPQQATICHSRHGMRHVIAFRAVALAVVADAPEFVSDAGRQGAGGEDADGGCRRGAGQLAGAYGMLTGG